MSATKELTNTLLKTKMEDAMVFRGEVSNMDECKLPGYYSLSPGTAVSATPPNIPDWNYGILEVLNRFKMNYLQRITTSGNATVERMWSGGPSGSWSAWKKVVKETV